jgi:hypothetical protein
MPPIRYPSWRVFLKIASHLNQIRWACVFYGKAGTIQPTSGSSVVKSVRRQGFTYVPTYPKTRVTTSKDRSGFAGHCRPGTGPWLHLGGHGDLPVFYILRPGRKSTWNGGGLVVQDLWLEPGRPANHRIETEDTPVPDRSGTGVCKGRAIPGIIRIVKRVHTNASKVIAHNSWNSQRPLVSSVRAPMFAA